MSSLDDEVRRSLRELAGEGRPVFLGRAALTGARRRRRTRLGVAAVAAAAAIAIAVPVGLTGGSRPDGRPATEPPSPGLAGQLVVTSYIGGTPSGSEILDPATGEYRRGATMPSAPNLRLGLDSSNRRVISPFGDDPTPVPWPRPVGGAYWSPDSTHLAGPVAGSGPVTATAAPGGPGTPRLFREVQVVDLESQTGWEVPLDLPPDRGGTRLFWLDARHLAVPVADPETAVEVPPRYRVEDGGGVTTVGGGTYLVVDEVRVYALDGTLTQRVAVDQRDYRATGDPHRIWSAAGPVGDGAVLLRRQPTETTVELAALDPAGAGPPHTASLTLPEPPAEHFWHGAGLTPVVGGQQVLVQARLRVEPTSPRAADADLFAATEHYLADLATGSVRPAHVPAAPDLDGAYHPWTFGDAAWLPPAAAHLAFAP